jgi:hypothetical protein
MEQMLMLLAPYPFFKDVTFEEYNDQFKVTIIYELNDIMMCLSFIRAYVFLRYPIIISRFMNPRSKRICTMNGCDANLMFAVKSFMK